jgi:hypothetical protein
MAKFIVDPKSVASQMEFISLFDVNADDLSAKVDQKTKEMKLEDDQPIFRVPVTAVVSGKEGKKRADNNIGISVLKKVDIKAGVSYVPAGKVRVTPYIVESGSGENKRSSQALSIIADTLVPVEQNDQKS